MGLAYANPPFSLLAKGLTKIAYEGGRVVMCTPHWGCSGENAHWRRMLDGMTVGRVQLPDGPIYVPEDSDTAMQAPEWASFLSIVDGSLNPVPLCDLHQVLLKEVMAENRGLTLFDVKNRSPGHLSATLTGCESPDDYLEPAAVKEDADDQLSEIASTIPPVDPSCVDLKHSAFLAQLLLEEVDLESTSEPASPVGKPVLHMQPTPMILAAVFSQNSISQQKGVFSREMTYFFGFYGPRIGGGGPPTQNLSKNIKNPEIWPILGYFCLLWAAHR